MTEDEQLSALSAAVVRLNQAIDEALEAADNAPAIDGLGYALQRTRYYVWTAVLTVNDHLTAEKGPPSLGQ